MKYFGTKNNKDYGFYLEKFENAIEITDEYWNHLLAEQSAGKRIIKYGNSVIAVNEIEYSFENGEWKKLSTQEFEAKQLKIQDEIRMNEIKEELEEIDNKRIRAICEPEFMNTEAGTTWLEYYNSRAKELREELESLSV